jgi:hypothetical protein
MHVRTREGLGSSLCSCRNHAEPGTLYELVQWAPLQLQLGVLKPRVLSHRLSWPAHVIHE